jgi:CubicO group peptidase (beta-lactamase class C family)
MIGRSYRWALSAPETHNANLDRRHYGTVDRLGYSERALTSTGDIAPTPAMGQGFGLGFAVRTAAGHNPLPGSIGNYYWTGAWGTTFWVDPAEKLVAIQMIQTPSESGGPYRRAFRNLVYQALTNQE